MGKRFKQILHQRKQMDSKQTYKKMVSIIGHCENANQNHDEKPSQILQKKGYNQEPDNKCWEDMKKPSDIASRNVKKEKL